MNGAMVHAGGMLTATASTSRGDGFGCWSESGGLAASRVEVKDSRATESLVKESQRAWYHDI